MHNSFTQHHDFGGYIGIGAVFGLLNTFIVAHNPLWQGLSAIATIAAAGISIYFAFRNRKR